VIEERDKERIRCRRLGHDVPFAYCRVEGGMAANSRASDGAGVDSGAGHLPCPLVLDCWWERFDARRFLEDNLPRDAYEEIMRRSCAPSKIQSLAGAITEAKRRLTRESPDSG